MIEVRYKARMGNNLFQYCLGRILAEELGFALQAKVIPGFPNTTQAVRGARHERPEQVLSGQRIDLDEILTDRRPRRLVIDGWFQRYEYYRPYRARIREWLAFDRLIELPDVRADVVLNVRRTDYVQLGWALPARYYEEAVERLALGGGEIWIVTDDESDPFFRRLAHFRPHFFTGRAVQQLLFMANARNLVMSQSTFSWWPAFLGNPRQVVCPVPAFGAWSGEGDTRGIDLIERDRFLCIDCPALYRPTEAEARYQKRRLLRRRLTLALNRRLHLSLPEPAH